MNKDNDKISNFLEITLLKPNITLKFTNTIYFRFSKKLKMVHLTKKNIKYVFDFWDCKLLSEWASIFLLAFLACLIRKKCCCLYNIPILNECENLTNILMNRQLYNWKFGNANFERDFNNMQWHLHSIKFSKDFLCYKPENLFKLFRNPQISK